MSVLTWVLLAITAVIVGAILWNVFILGRRGAALVWSLLAMAVFTATGIAVGEYGWSWRTSSA